MCDEASQHDFAEGVVAETADKNAGAADLRRLGVMQPRELASRDAFALYRALCELTGKRQDPCVLDTFLAAADFMRGAEPRPWWTYTAQRKAVYGAV